MLPSGLRSTARLQEFGTSEPLAKSETVGRLVAGIPGLLLSHHVHIFSDRREAVLCNTRLVQQRYRRRRHQPHASPYQRAPGGQQAQRRVPLAMCLWERRSRMANARALSWNQSRAARPKRGSPLLLRRILPPGLEWVQPLKLLGHPLPCIRENLHSCTACQRDGFKARKKGRAPQQRTLPGLSGHAQDMASKIFTFTFTFTLQQGHTCSRS